MTPERTDLWRRDWRRGLAGLAMAVTLVGACTTVVHASSAAMDADEMAFRARHVESQLIAPCCFMQTVDNHSSPIADEIKQDIWRRLREGQSETQILDAYRERYGERILAVPRAQGFNVLAYVVPPGFLVGSMAVVELWVRRRVRVPMPSPLPPPQIDDCRWRARLEAELAQVEP